MPGLTLETLDRVAARACRAVAYACSLGVGGPILYHLAHGSPAHLGLYEDDFFYYVVLADNLVRLGKLTFDGVTLTNGVHPLWFGVVLLVRLVCGSIGTAFFAGVGVVLLGAMVATYEALWRFAEALGARRSVAVAVAALQSMVVNQIIATGMEVAIAIPLFVWWLTLVARGGAVDGRRAARIGLVASLTVLARLDLALAVGLFVGLWSVAERPGWRRGARVALGFGAGLSPLFAVLGVNALFFRSVMPMSALAKQIRTGFHPNPNFFHSLMFDTFYGNRAVPAVLLGLVLLVFPKRPLSRSARLGAAVALLFPVVFFAVQGTLTDWVLFNWYSYPFVAAAVTALVLAWDYCAAYTPPGAHVVAAGLALAATVTSVAARSARYFVRQGPRFSVADNTLTAMGFELERRLRGYRGRFAMGDKAAGVAFVLGRPLVHLEGLMADRRMLEHIRHGDSLAAFADEYAVDYLIVSAGTTHPERRDGCYVVSEPNLDQAGPESAKSRTEICAEPIVHFVTPHGPNPWSRWRSLETYVFDLRGDKRRALRSL